MKSNSSHERGNDLHAEIVHLLPWYVKHTLPANELNRVEAHLDSCAACQREVLRCQDLTSYQFEDIPSWTPSASHFSAIMQRVDAYEAELAPKTNLKNTKRSLFSKISWWFAQTPSPMQWALALETAACLGLLLFIATPLIHNNPDASSYQTLSNTDSAASANGRLIRLVFADDMTIKEIADLMELAQAQIRQGPSAVGSYTIEVPKQVADNSLKILRSHAKVTLAQPIAQSAQE